MQNQVLPSGIFRSKSGQLFRQFENGGILEKANAVYQEKTFLERFKPHYQAANLASLVFQTLSALFAFTFAQRLAAGVLPQWSPLANLVLSGLVAGVLLCGIEVFKRLCLGSFVVSYIQSRALQSGVRASWLSLALNVLLIGLAVYTSTQGAKEFAQRQTDKSETIKGGFATQKDSLESSFQKQIEAEKKDLADFKKSVTWKGRVDMSNRKTESVIASHNNRLEQLQNERQKALAS
ncbi:MAG: hypothetical protein AAB316_02760, partial [Bacteroidota bacterium]